MRPEVKRGYIASLFCYLLWGFLPIYWKLLIPISSSVIIIYRILLVFLVSLGMARTQYSWERIFSPLREKGTLLKYFSAGLIVTVNWSTYIWAVNSGHVVQSSLGYYIEPLMICLFGIVLFHEKLTRWKGIAIGFASFSVLIILIHFGEVPGIALMIALTFSVYSAIKKTAQQPAIISLVYETMLLAPVALGIIIYIESRHQGALGVGEPYQYALMLLCGFATAVPLALFGHAAQHIDLCIVGLISYLSPTISLMVGIFLFKETIDAVQVACFGLIWVGLVFFTIGEFKNR